MDQLAAVYPELGRPGAAPTTPPVNDGSIKRAVKPLDFDALVEEVEVSLQESTFVTFILTRSARVGLF